MAVVRESVRRWFAGDAPTHSAALAFYTLFSLGPMLLVAGSIAGALFGQAATRDTIERQIYKMTGPQAAATVREVLASAAEPELQGIMGLVGVVTLLLGATAVFGQLQSALNEVWEVEPKPGHAVRSFLRKRLLSFGLVIVIGFLLVVSLILDTALSAVGAYLGRVVEMPPWVLASANFSVFLGLVAVLFALIYRVLPDARIGWKDVAIGAACTALLFATGKVLIGYYLGQSDVASVYGVAGSLVIVLLWVYYSSMVVLLGAGFTRVWSRRHRPLGVVPESGAERRPGKGSA